MYNNHSLADYRDRQWQQKYTYKLGALIIRAIAAWGRFVTIVAAITFIPVFIVTAILRKRNVIGIVGAIGLTQLAAHTVSYA